ncbi:MAG: hypothetical protein HQ538_06535 [Parcubacteria group bacterium]|nr:hypothetical protein [Parcubacteria group bacterium]
MRHSVELLNDQLLRINYPFVPLSIRIMQRKEVSGQPILYSSLINYYAILSHGFGFFAATEMRIYIILIEFQGCYLFKFACEE